MRYQLFKSGIYDEELLPPTLDSLRCRIKRVNYQSYIWRNATKPIHNLDDFQNHGCMVSESGIVIEWLMNPVAPDSILNFLKCDCTTGCDTKCCSCVKSALKCSEPCNFSKYDNTASADDEDIHDNGVEDYNEYEDQFLEDDLL